MSNHLQWSDDSGNEELEPKIMKRKRRNSYLGDDEEWNDDYNYISMLRGNRQTRGKNQDPRELIESQIAQNPLFWKCILHSKLIEYLVTNKYTDIDDYVKYCNKRGVLLDVPIKQYYSEPIEQTKFNLHYMKHIHSKNKIQRSLENMQDEVRLLKVNKEGKKNDSVSNIIKFYDPNAVREEYEMQINRQRTIGKSIKQINQHNNRLAKQVKQIYEESPLDQPISESIIQDNLLEFIQYCKETIEKFEPKKRVREVQEEFEIDYDSLSDDSLETICAVHPRDRAGFKSLSFVNHIQVIGVIHIDTFNYQIQQQSQI